MADVNSIRCCGFDKGYSILEKSRNGCLNKNELFKTALLSYQIDMLASNDCLTQEQYSSLFDKLSLTCGCCTSDLDVTSNQTTSTECACYVVFGASGSCFVEYIDCNGDSQSYFSEKNKYEYFCARRGTVSPTCINSPFGPPINVVEITGGEYPCDDSGEGYCDLCYYYLQINDSTCSQFSTGLSEWTLNGYSQPNWTSLMTTSPFSGNAVQFTQPGEDAPCGGEENNSYYFWTLSYGYNAPIPLSGVNSLGYPVTYEFTKGACTSKCFKGEDIPLDSPILVSFVMDEVSVTINIDLLSPTVYDDILNQLGPYLPPFEVTQVYEVDLTYTMLLSFVYTTSTSIKFYNDLGEEFEIIENNCP